MLNTGINRFFVDVGDKYLGALFTQQAHQVIANVAGTLHGEAVFAYFFVAKLVLQCSANALNRAVGREWRRIARSRWPARALFNQIFGNGRFNFTATTSHRLGD